MADHTLQEGAVPRTRVGGRYALGDELGRGGMASVHRAHDEVLDREVAVKILHPHLALDPAFLERFRREARAAAALSHPNLVGVHDWGEDDDGAFLVLQLVDGVSLRDVLRDRGRLRPQEALSVLGPAADGLAAAHASGLVHRDVKPENLLIGRDGTVRVTDFGLARAAASATSTFGADVLVGSPHYLSPEAVDGIPLDARADVYALGIVLFECLTGAPPHEGDSPFATALRHTTSTVPAPSTRTPDLSEAIDDVVALATAVDRDERLPDAAAFARMLRAAVPGGPAPMPRTAAAPNGAGDAGTRPDPPRPHRRVTAVVARPGDDEPTAGPTTIVDRSTDVVTPPPGEERSTRHAVTPVPTRRRRRWLFLVMLVVLVGGSALGGYLVWDRLLAPVTAIPGVLGAAEPAAAEQLAQAGFEVEVQRDRPHDLVIPEGHVLAQEPADAARLGSTVVLVVSAGPAQIPVAEVVGEDLDEARGRLEADNFSVVVRETYDERAPRGEVVASAPEAGEVVDEASEVTLVVSIGPAPIEVPGLVGIPLGEAETRLSELGLIAVEQTRRHDPSPAGTVLAQDPEPESSLTRGGEVSLTVSDGPEQVEVPGVRGMLAEEALADLTGRGFTVEIERQGGLSAFFRPGRVFDQDPAPGSLRDLGSTVVVYAYED